MKDFTCDWIQDRIADLGTGRLPADERDAIEAHLGTGCDACASALEVVRALQASPPARMPAGLEQRLQTAARAALVEGRTAAPSRHRTPAAAPARWALALAAGLVLALGIPQLMQRATGPADILLDDATLLAQVEAFLPAPFADDDAFVVAGAPVFDGLSDEALLQLLDEMTP